MIASASRLVDTTLVHEGVPGIAMEGERLRLTLFPDAGAKILDLVHRPTDENLLWQNPRVPLRRTYPGAAFDDVWCGGWDELFPTDAACEIGDNTSTITATSGTDRGTGRSRRTTARRRRWRCAATPWHCRA